MAARPLPRSVTASVRATATGRTLLALVTAALLALPLAAVAAGTPAAARVVSPAAVLTAQPPPDAYPPTPDVPCDAGALRESTQGRVPLAEVASGRAAKGYRCNALQVGHFGVTGGFRVESYLDRAGHVCAFYDTTLLFPKDTLNQGVEGTGTYVMDMSDPAHPVHTDTLRTPAMQSPHESLRLNKRRGLLVATLSYPTFNPGFVDVYDVTADCRHPALQSSTPLGVLGHESGFSPDGLTYYAGSLYGRTLAAVDLTNPMVPSVLWVSTAYQPHGMSVSDDGRTLYIAESSFGSDPTNPNGFRGLTVLDVSQVQNRTLNPSVPVISRLTWPNVGTPQTTEPFTRAGHPYLMETDEYGSGTHVGAGRIIDIADIHHPRVISNMRLQVHQAANQADPSQAKDPGASEQFQGYEGHYCTLPTRVDPKVVACSFIVSGFRLFDIADLTHPQELAYFNGAVLPSSNPLHQGAFAMAAPAFSPRHAGEYWYSDGNLGFFALRTTPGAHHVAGLTAAHLPAKPSASRPGVNPPPAGAGFPASPGAPAGAPVSATTRGAAPRGLVLAHTGGEPFLPVGLGFLCAAALLRCLQRRSLSV